MLSEKLSASPNRIDLWVARPGDIADETLLTQYRSLLAPDEEIRMQRLVREQDRHRFLVTRALTRVMLSRYLSVDPQKLEFGKNRYGRPFLAKIDTHFQPLSFNITHTHDCVAIGITRQRTIGIDIESTGRKAAAIGVANRFFSPLEHRALNDLPPEHQHTRFFAYWTLKEAYIKARGMGLAIPLSKFSFDFTGPDTFALYVDEALEDDASAWQFWQIGVEEEFLVSVCASALEGPLPQLKLKEITPFAGEASLPYRPVASSHGWSVS